MKQKIDNKQIRIDLQGIGEAVGTLKRLARFETEVGIFDPKVAEYAAKMEFGATNKDGTITPPRSFVRSTATEKAKELLEQGAEAVKEVFFERGGKSEPTFYDIETRVFEPMAKTLEGSMVNKIWNRIPPPLSKRRLAEKRAKQSPFPDIPLIDTGKLVSSITYKIKRLNKPA